MTKTKGKIKQKLKSLSDGTYLLINNKKYMKLGSFLIDKETEEKYYISDCFNENSLIIILDGNK